MERDCRAFLAIAAVSVLSSCAMWPEEDKSNGKLLVEVGYGPQTITSQAYEIKVEDRVAVFTGIRNVKTRGVHSYPISQEQYEAVRRLVKNSPLGRSESPNPLFGPIAGVTTRLDDVTTNTLVGVTNLKPFLVFRKALEDILDIRAFRCPYELGTGGLDLCAVNDEFEEKVLRAD